MTSTKLAVALVVAVAGCATAAPAASAASQRSQETVGFIVKTYWKGGGMADFRHAVP
jgi:ABC-type sugar transport system substrate-binding protein